MVDIATALSRINVTYDDNNQPAIFALKFVKANGSIRHIAKARKSVKLGNLGGGKSGKGKFRYNMKEKGTLIIYDTEAKEKENFRTIKISRIIEFNSERIKH